MTTTAVLIGGPADLTRMVVEGHPPYIVVASFSGIGRARTWSATDESPFAPAYESHEYRRYFDLPNGNYVYYWLGVR